MISVLDGVDAGDRNQISDQHSAATCADSDNLESITTPRSRADSTTLIVVDWSGITLMLIITII